MAKNNSHKRRSKSGIQVSQPKRSGFTIPNQPIKTLDTSVNANGLNPRVSFQMIDTSSECITDWTAEECKQLFDRLRYFCSMPWQQVLATSGKGKGKTGLGYTLIPDKSLNRTWPSNISKDCVVSEIRICQKKRVFGIRNEATYYLLWLDRTHSALKGGS